MAPRKVSQAFHRMLLISSWRIAPRVGHARGLTERHNVTFLIGLPNR
jgi:hypothetical protein